MAQATTTIVIDRPINEVFAALQDYPNYPTWQPNVLTARHQPAGSIQVGSRIYEQRRFMGQAVESVGIVTAYQWPTESVVESAPESPANEPTFRSTTHCAAMGNRTQVTFTIVLRGHGLFTLLSPIIQLGLRRDLRARFRRFKAVLEQPLAVTERTDPITIA